MDVFSIVITFSQHALDRLAERSISKAEVFECLQNGACGPPVRQSDGKLTMAYTHGALTVILGKDLSIITAYRAESP